MHDLRVLRREVDPVLLELVEGHVQVRAVVARSRAQTMRYAAPTLSGNTHAKRALIALSAAAHTGEHHHLVAGDGEIDVLEVVLPSSSNADHVLVGFSSQLHRLRQRRGLGFGSCAPHTAESQGSQILLRSDDGHDAF